MHKKTFFFVAFLYCVTIYSMKQSLDQPLLREVENGNFLQAEELLKQGASVEATDKDEVTPLHWAAEWRMDLVKLLVTSGASVNAVAKGGRTPLHQAIKGRHENGGNVDIVRFLLKNGAAESVNIIDSSRNNLLEGTPLVTALWHYNTALVELLLKNGASGNIAGGLGFTPLHHAVWGGCTDIIKLLLEHGADPLMETGKKIATNAIDEAGELKQRRIIKRLLLEGRDKYIAQQVNKDAWPIIRLLWIGHFREERKICLFEQTNNCNFNKLPRELIHEICKYVYGHKARELGYYEWKEKSAPYREQFKKEEND